MSKLSTADEHTLTVKTISEIVNAVIIAYDRGEQINLTRLK
jgi:hypothetical protein